MCNFIKPYGRSIAAHSGGLVTWIKPETDWAPDLALLHYLPQPHVAAFVGCGGQAPTVPVRTSVL